jgi:hypothetical protein
VKTVRQAKRSKNFSFGQAYTTDLLLQTSKKRNCDFAFLGHETEPKKIQVLIKFYNLRWRAIERNVGEMSFYFIKRTFPCQYVAAGPLAHGIVRTSIRLSEATQ